MYISTHSCIPNHRHR